MLTAKEAAFKSIREDIIACDNAIEVAAADRCFSTTITTRSQGMNLQILIEYLEALGYAVKDISAPSQPHNTISMSWSHAFAPSQLFAGYTPLAVEASK